MFKMYCAFVVLLMTISFLRIPIIAENNSNADSPPSNWANDHIIIIKNTSGINIDSLMSKYQCNITRGEFAYLGVKLYEYYTGQEIIAGERYFTDTTDEWVLKAKRAGLVNGYPDNTYGAKENIHREQITALFVNVFIAADVIYKNETPDLFADDSTISNWAKKSVYLAKANNIISGIGENKFDPTGFATREQALVMLSKAITYIQKNIRLPKRGIDKIVLRDVESSIQNAALISGPTNIRVDKADYPFEADNLVLGQWIPVDFVSDPLVFDPVIKYTGNLHYDSVVFSKNGIFEYRTYEYYENGNWVNKSEYRSIPATWTKGLIMQNYLHEHTSSRYFLALVKNKEYLFLEFRNGDYIYRNATPQYYVFIRK